jgi:nicotinamide mononucleotide transporter
MSFNGFFDILYQNIIDSSWLEIVAASFGLISVWYAKKANILVYPTGIVSVLIYVYICFNSQLYADMGINFYYFIFSVYGWIMWSKKDENREEKPVSFCDKKNCTVSVLIFAVSIVVIITLLKIFKAGDIHYWSTGIPYIDTFTTSVFILGMWLMALKKVENWIFWIIGDVVSVPLYFYKGLVFTSLQFFVFLILAVLGYLEWRKLAKKELNLV